jgi:hypothetical protein
MKIEKYKDACNILRSIDKNPSIYLIVHYSCESFYDIKDGRTPRVTSIAIRSYDTGQTDSFSIHKAAEKMHIKVADIDKHYDELEFQMLSEYFEYIKEHKGYKWLHWNMRDINYGFKAIEHRYEVLGGEPIIILDNDKIDVARLFISKYGVRYISHPRMENLLELNNIQPKDFLAGAQEALAFDNKEYIRLHQSTLRKVDVFANLIERAIHNNLKTHSKWYEIYGISPQGLFEYAQQNWVLSLFGWMLTLVIGIILGKWIK